MQENIRVENTCLSKLKALFPELKQLLGRGWEETSIIILPSTKPRCNSCIKQDIMYYVGISAQIQNSPGYQMPCNAMTHAESRPRMVQS